MKTGKTLNELAAEITRQNESKKDFVVGTTSLVPQLVDNALQLKVGTNGDYKGDFGVTDITHGQIAEHLKIPKLYYDRMKSENPELLVNNIDSWFKKNPATRLVRTLDGNARAFLSDKFQPFDNYDFANAALPIIKERKLELVSCEVTEKRLYIKAIDTKEFKVPVGFKMGEGHQIFDVCCPAFIMSNSEVGFGRLSFETGVYTRRCTNLAWFGDASFKRTHVGARHKLLEEVSDLETILSDAAKQKTNEALWLQVRDVVGAAFDEKVIKTRADKLAAAAGITFKASEATKVIEVVREKFSLTEVEGNSILDHLMAGGDLSQHGLHAAITRTGQDATDYDRATELEYLGGKVIELHRSEFEQLAQAA